MATRLLGLVRERVFAHFFGLGLEADAFRAALKIPNVIRNLLGEGTLSASFIPVYAQMLERGETDAARRLAGAVVSFLLLVASIASVAGILLAPAITRVVAFGFGEEARMLTASLVRILFPMSGMLILSAWCLGVLNTNRRFFVTYAAPALWNVAQIATLVTLGGVLMGADLVRALAWGALAGTVLQLIVQLPATLRFTGRIRWTLNRNVGGFRKVVRAWLPVIAGAGALQISSLVDIQLAALLGQGAVANLGYAQLIGILPVSLFGISVAAASLPELSREAITASPSAIQDRLSESIRRIWFFVLPSAAAFVAISPAIVGLILQSGAFDASSTQAVAVVLMGIGFGLPAAALIRLLASGHYAFGDTKAPVRISFASITVSAVSGYVLMQQFGVLGIALGGAIGAYTNALLNLVALHRRVGSVLSSVTLRYSAIAMLGAAAAGLAARGAVPLVSDLPVSLRGLVVMAVFGAVYLSIVVIGRHPDARFGRTAPE